MIHVNPALIISGGQFGSSVNDSIKKHIASLHEIKTSPQIFGFLCTPDSKQDLNSEIQYEYTNIRSKYAINCRDTASKYNVDSNGVNVFMIFPLDPDNFEQAIRISTYLSELAEKEVTMTRNAVFMISRKLLSLKAVHLQTALIKLSEEMQKPKFPFHRVFFVDEVNESGQTITKPEDLVELIARFISQVISAEMLSFFNKEIPKYEGIGSGNKPLYASFCCSTISFDADLFTNGLSKLLAKDVCNALFRDKTETDINLSEKINDWYRQFKEDTIDKINNSDIEKRFNDFHNQSEFNNEYEKILNSLQSSNISIDDPINTKIYQEEEKKLNLFTEEVLLNNQSNLSHFSDFISKCCRFNQVCMEYIKFEAEKIKAKISEALIKILLGLDIALENKVFRPDKKIITYPYKPLAFILWCIALAFLIIKLLSDTGIIIKIDILGYYDYLFIPIVSLVAYILWRLKKIEFEKQPPVIIQATWEEVKNIRMNLHKLYYDTIAIWLNFHLRLDWAKMNIELLRKKYFEDEETEPKPVNKGTNVVSGDDINENNPLNPYTEINTQKTEGLPVYDMDLQNELIVQKYFSEKYAIKKYSDIDDFISSRNTKSLHESLFSYPKFKLYEFLENYCNNIFESLRQLTLDSFFKLRNELMENDKSQPASTPFWNPVSPANQEKHIYVSLPEGNDETLRDYFFEMFNGHSINFKNTQKKQLAILIQVSYGLELWEIFKKTPEDFYKWLKIGNKLGLTNEESEIIIEKHN